MKTATLTLCIIFGLLLSITHAQAQSEQTNINDFIGTWEYTSQNAPYAYQQGKLIIANKDEEPSVTIIFSNGKEIQAKNVTVEDQQLGFSIYIEGETVSVQLEPKEEDQITGYANTTEGEIALTAVRE